jgi:hypothetical protein
LDGGLTSGFMFPRRSSSPLSNHVGFLSGYLKLWSQWEGCVRHGLPMPGFLPACVPLVPEPPSNSSICLPRRRPSAHPPCCTPQHRSLGYPRLPSLSCHYALYACMYGNPCKSPSDRCTFEPEYGHDRDLLLAQFPPHWHCQILQ